LHSAAAGGDVQLVQLLLREGADAAAETVGGMTPLAAAALKGHMEVVRVLLAHPRHHHRHQQQQQQAQPEKLSQQQQQQQAS